MLVAVLFLIANRQPVAISLDPFSASEPAITTMALPLWLWLMVILMIGFSLGSFGMWASGRERRTKARADKKLVKDLKKEVAALQARLPKEDPADLEPLPALQTETLA